MIDFVKSDDKLPMIQQESKLFNLVTRYRYHIYGLRQEGNPPVVIEFHYDNVDENFDKKVDAVSFFLEQNGIAVETYSQAETNRIDIGLRRDLRRILNSNKKPLLASAVLQSIIYALEGRADLEQLKKYRITVKPILEKEESRSNNNRSNTDRQ